MGRAALAGTIALSLAPGFGPAAAQAAGNAARYGGVLHVVMPWAGVPDNFNPLAPGQAATTAGGTGSAIYEPLMYFNPYNGRVTDILATGYAWADGGRTLDVSTRPGVAWSDGQPFSAADVAFTFNYIGRFPALDRSGIWRDGLISVEATGPGTVVLRFGQPDTAALPFVGEQLIVPEHIWSGINDPVSFTNPKPVGTGPFVLQSRTRTTVNYKKNPSYWLTGRPYISGISMQAVKSDAAAQLSLMAGKAAYTSVPIAAPSGTYGAANPAWDQWWWPVTGVNFLYMGTQRPPFDDITFRRAVAMAINNHVVAGRAYFGAIPAASGPAETGVTDGQLAEWAPASLRPLEWSYNPAGALRLLEAHGYELVDGLLDAPGGAALPTYKIVVGADWTDYISMAETIGQELLSIGIRTTISQEPVAAYNSSARTGRFDLLIGWSSGNGPTPYYEYNDLLRSGPPGSPRSTSPAQGAGTDYERFSSPGTDAALADFAATTSLARQRADIVSIERAVLSDVPVVALTGRPDFFEYTTRYFTGWPDAADPYNAGEAPDSFTGGAEELYVNVHLN